MIKEKKKQEKNILSELFDVNKFLNDKNMIEKYSQHLNKVLINSNDSWIQQKHKEWLEAFSISKD